MKRSLIRLAGAVAFMIAAFIFWHFVAAFLWICADLGFKM